MCKFMLSSLIFGWELKWKAIARWVLMDPWHGCLQHFNLESSFSSLFSVFCWSHLIAVLRLIMPTQQDIQFTAWHLTLDDELDEIFFLLSLDYRHRWEFSWSCSRFQRDWRKVWVRKINFVSRLTSHKSSSMHNAHTNYYDRAMITME